MEGYVQTYAWTTHSNSRSQRLSGLPSLWPIDHAFDDKLALPVLAILGDLKRLKSVLELERVGEEGFEIDKSSGHKINRERAKVS
jgi:hypothetical protein